VSGKDGDSDSISSSTIENGNHNDKLLKSSKNQVAVTMVTAMGLARSWQSCRKGGKSKALAAARQDCHDCSSNIKQDNQLAPNNCNNNGKWKLQGFGTQ